MTMINPYYEQDSARGYADGTESGSTAKAAVNTGWTENIDTPAIFHIRILVQETAGPTTPATLAVRLQYDKNGAEAWTDCTTLSQHVIIAPSANITDGDDTTQRIGVGTYITNNNWVVDLTDGTTLATTTTFSLNEAEALFSVKFVNAEWANGDTCRFRVVLSGGGLLNNYVAASLFNVTIQKTSTFKSYFAVCSNPPVIQPKIGPIG